MNISTVSLWNKSDLCALVTWGKTFHHPWPPKPCWLSRRPRRPSFFIPNPNGDLSMTDTDKTLTRDDLARELHLLGCGSKAQAHRLIGRLIDLIPIALRRGHTIHLKGLGRFEGVETTARTGRDLRTGEPIEIPAGRRFKFSPSRPLRHFYKPRKVTP